MKPPVCQIVATIILAAGLLCTGCDDPAGDIPKEVLDQQAKQAEAAKTLPKIPTTQELVNGPRTVTALGPLPMTMRVPASWEVKVAGGATLLSGFTPNGEVAIQLTSRPSLKKASFDSLVKSDKKEQAEKPQSILKVEVRPMGDMLIYERQAVGDPAPYTVFDKNMKERTTTEQMFKWTISVLAPSSDAYQRYELNFVGLTKSQYDQDKQFLQGILDTLSAGGAGGGTATTSPAATPAATPAAGSASPATLP